MGWSKDPGPPKDGDFPRHFFCEIDNLWGVTGFGTDCGPR